MSIAAKPLAGLRKTIANLDAAELRPAWLRPDWLLIGALMFTIVAMYYPVYSSFYLHHDDYCFFHPAPGEHAVQFWGSVGLGRPLLAFWVDWIGSLIQSVEDANKVRFLGVFGVALSAAATYVWFRMNRISRLHAWSLCVLTFALPAFQVFTFWACCSVNSYAIFLAIVANILLYRTVSAPTPHSPFRSAFACLGPAFLLWAALCLNQPAALFGWFLIGVMLLQSDVHKMAQTRKALLVFFGTHFFAMGTYVVAYKWLYLPSTRDGCARAEYATEFSDKLRWFVTEVLVNCLNYWSIIPNLWVTVTVLLLMACGAVLRLMCLRRSVNEPAMKNALTVVYFESFVWFAMLVPLAYLPNLVVKENHASYRTTCVIGPLLLYVGYFAIQQLELLTGARWFHRISSTVLIGLVVVSIGHVRTNLVYYAILPRTLEITHVINVLNNSEIGTGTKVRIIPPEPDRPYWCRYDEFGLFSTRANVGNPVLVGCCALKELGIEPKFEMIQIGYSSQQVLEPGTVIIRMSQAEALANQRFLPKRNEVD